MDDTQIRLDLFGDILLNTMGLWLWQFDNAFSVVSTTCPNASVFEGLFNIIGNKQAMLEFFERQSIPCVAMDPLGLNWFVVPAHASGEMCYATLGPVFNTSISEQNLNRILDDLGVAMAWRCELVRNISAVPVVQTISLLQYGLMLHYCVNGERIAVSDIQFLQRDANTKANELKPHLAENKRISYAFETEYFKTVEQGNIHYHPKIDGNFGQVGILVQDDPLRQVKNSLIVSITLTVRAALRGGLPEDTAYALSDAYLQRLEKTNTPADAYQVHTDAYNDFRQRVYNLKVMEGRSREIQNCIGYIEAHLLEKLDFSKLAESLGYNRTYLANKFKKEMGMTMTDYIAAQKMELAKLWLRNTGKSISDIATELGYGSNSYFTALFHKQFGISPTSFRDSTKN